MDKKDVSLLFGVLKIRKLEGGYNDMGQSFEWFIE
jgi:hypothetical protein